MAISNTLVVDAEKQYSEKNDGSVNVCFASDKNIKELLLEKKFNLKYISRRQGIYETHKKEKNKDVREALCEEIFIAIQDNHPDITEIELMRVSYYYDERLLFIITSVVMINKKL